MRLYLVRHGRTAWNIQGKLQGHANTRLDEVGLAQARALGEAFRGSGIKRLIASDLDRAVMTAEFISEATGLPIERRPDLREKNFGDWEGKDVREAASLALEAALTEGLSTTFVRSPNGESHADVWDRVGQLFNELAESEDDVAVVGHGISCAALISRFLRGTVETSRTFRLPNTSVTEFERRSAEYFTMLRYADVSHLSTMAVSVGSASAVKV